MIAHNCERPMKPLPLYIDGHWESSNEFTSVFNPADDQLIAGISVIGRARVRGAIESSRIAFQTWKNLPGIIRGRYLRAIADQLGRQASELARTITLENGKPLSQSRDEVEKAVDLFHWFAEEARRGYGRAIPNQTEGKRHIVIRQPVGVVGAITPWNFPIALAARKIAPALAAGCPVLLKPAVQTPLSSVELARCVAEADLPPGIFQLLIGEPSEIANELLENPDCRKISFTGSTRVGKMLIQGAAATCTRLSLELGGNAPVLVFDDADFEIAVESALLVKYRNTGQSCVSANRFYIHRTIYKEFLEAFAEKSRKLKIGNGLDDSVDIGPLISRQGLESALQLIENAVGLGARLISGGSRWGSVGNFLEPTILADIPEGALCIKEEIFAPIAVFYPFDTEEEVITKANDTEYGLAAYVFTNDLNRSIRLAERLEAGTIGLNDPVPATSNCPFGGVKQSGWGRELGSEGLDAFLETKHISIGNVHLLPD